MLLLKKCMTMQKRTDIRRMLECMDICNTVKGCGSSVMENKANWHHKVPTQEEYDQIIADFAARKEAALHE